MRDQWRSNCLAWATSKMALSILDPLARSAPDDAEDLVAAAAEHIRERSGAARGWRNHQFALTTGSATGPNLVMTLEEGLASMQAICDVICEIYDWQPLTLPSRLDTLTGGYHSTTTPPPGWPASANRHEVVSLAVTRARQFCWTSPAELTEALPAAPGQT